MSTKNNKSTVGVSEELNKVNETIKSVASEFKGGLGTIMTDHLKVGEKARLEKKVIELGVSAHKTLEEIQKGFESIKQGDIISNVAAPTDDNPLNTNAVLNFSTQRVKLRPLVKKAADELAKAFDKAYLEGTEEAWDALKNPTKEAIKQIAAIKEHLKK